MRQQAGFLEHGARSTLQVLERGCGTQARKRVARRRVTQFRLITRA